MKQYCDISIYCKTYYSNTIQYGLRKYQYIAHCNILWYIAIYCNVCCLNVVNAQSLHHKNDWTSKNLDYTLEFLMLLYGYTGCILFTLLPKPIFPYKMYFYQNPIKYCNMAIYCNILKHNMQYDIHPYCFIPTCSYYVQALRWTWTYYTRPILVAKTGPILPILVHLQKI